MLLEWRSRVENRVITKMKRLQVERDIRRRMISNRVSRVRLIQAVIGHSTVKIRFIWYYQIRDWGYMGRSFSRSLSSLICASEHEREKDEAEGEEGKRRTKTWQIQRQNDSHFSHQHWFYEHVAVRSQTHCCDVVLGVDEAGKRAPNYQGDVLGAHFAL